MEVGVLVEGSLGYLGDEFSVDVKKPTGSRMELK